MFEGDLNWPWKRDVKDYQQKITDYRKENMTFQGMVTKVCLVIEACFLADELVLTVRVFNDVDRCYYSI